MKIEVFSGDRRLFKFLLDNIWEQKSVKPGKTFNFNNKEYEIISVILHKRGLSGKIKAIEV